MQVSGGFCKIPRTSVIVREGCTKRTPSELFSITEPCLSSLTIETALTHLLIVLPVPA